MDYKKFNFINSVKIMSHSQHSYTTPCLPPPGTPVSDTVCKRCPPGYFSTSDSATEPCQPHRNCSDLGLKTLRWGTSTTDSLCGTTTLECSQHQTVCHNGKTLCHKALQYSSLSLIGIVWGGWD